MDIRELFPDHKPSRRSQRLVRGSGETSHLAPSDTLLGIEQRLKRAQRQRAYDLEHVTVSGGQWTVRIMTPEELEEHYNRVF